MMNIGFIGLGIMGSRMAANLLNHGHTLAVYNRTKSKAKELIDSGADWMETPADMGKKSELVITMLSSPKVIKEIALGPNGLLQNMSEGKLWMNCSTVNPSFSREMADLCWERGIKYIDAPVAGTKAPAEKGELLFLVGGQKEDVSRVQSLLDIMGNKTLHLGEVGRGSGLKMLINLLLGQSMLAFSEAMVLGEEMGFEKESLLNILLNVPVTAAFLSTVRPKLETGDFEPNFPLQWIQKDLQLASNTAYELGIAMPSLNTAKEVFAMARQSGYAEKDFSAIYDYLQK